MFPWQVMTGLIVSWTCTEKLQVAVLPELSVATKLFTVVPTGKNPPEAMPFPSVTDATWQLSDEVAAR